MSDFQAFVNDVVNLTNVPGAAQSYLRGQIITQGVRLAQSANNIISSLTQAGIGIRRQQGLQLVREEQDRQAAGATSAQLDLSTPVAQLLSATAPAGWTGQFVHQVTVTWRERDAEGNYLLQTRPMGIKSSQILTPEEAIAAAQGILEQTPAEAEQPYPIPLDAVLSYSLTGAWYDIQGRNLPTT